MVTLTASEVLLRLGRPEEENNASCLSISPQSSGESSANEASGTVKEVPSSHDGEAHLAKGSVNSNITIDRKSTSPAQESHSEQRAHNNAAGLEDSAGTGSDLDGDGDSSECVAAEKALAFARVRAEAFIPHSSHGGYSGVGNRSRRSSHSASNEEVSQGSAVRPSLIHKKSGEIVKPLLRVRPGLSRTLSEPSTKAVHFNTDLIDVRPFKKTQRPSAVSHAKAQFRLGSNSEGEGHDHADADDDDDENEADNDDDFSDSDNDDDDSCTLLTPGFTPHKFSRLAGAERPIAYLDSLQLASDQCAIVATVYVSNVSYEKYVGVRYTVDSWRTFTEVRGVWSSDRRKFDRDANYDRFDVRIPIDYLPSTAMFLCVKFDADGVEHWDNNDGKNYELFLRRPGASMLKQQRSQSESSLLSAVKVGNNNLNSASTKASSVAVPSVDEILRRARLDDDGTDTGGDTDERVSTASTQDFLKRAGIPMRKTRQEPAAVRDPFQTRYSFKTAFSSPPRPAPSAMLLSPHGSLDSSANSTAESSPINSPIVSTIGESPVRAHEIQARPESRPETTSSTASVTGETSANAQCAAWESQSYKDFVSKYCFYTPMAPRAPERPGVTSATSIFERESSPKKGEKDSSPLAADFDLPARRASYEQHA